MFRLNHRSIKVTLFSEKHIKIFSKRFLTYHQNAFCGFFRRQNTGGTNITFLFLSGCCFCFFIVYILKYRENL